MLIIVLAIAWFAGLAAGNYTTVPVEIAVAAGVVSAMLAVVWWRKAGFGYGLLGIAVLVAGLLRSEVALPEMSNPPIAHHNDRGAVSLRGVVVDTPSPRGPATELRVAVEELRPASEESWQRIDGTVLVRVPNEPAWRYGDYVELRGPLETPPDFDGFAYREYLARQGIGSLMRYPQAALLDEDHAPLPLRLLQDIRTALASALERSLPEPEASLGQGILLGRRTAIPPALMEQFSATNTTHVIAISGTNVTLLVAALLFVSRRLFSRRVAAALAIAGIVAYALLVGSSPSVVRAAVMGILFTIGTYAGRRRDTLAGLAFAGALMTLFDPAVILDLGFQLSFLATAGLVLLAEPIERRLSGLGGPVLAPLHGLLAVTLAAEVTTVPVILLITGRLSLIGPIANLIVPPLLPPVMLSTAGTAIAGAIWLPLGQALGIVAWLFLAAMVWAVEMLGSLSWATLPLGQPGFELVVAYYGLLAGFMLHHLSPTTPIQRSWQAAWSRLPAVPLLGGLTLAVAISWSAALSLPDAALHVTVMDVGQGDAILIRTAEHKVLVDGGPDPDALANALGRRLPFWDRRIDLIVLTHPEQDHIGGLPAVLERYEVSQVLDSAAAGTGATYQRWLELIRAKNVKRTVAAAGEQIDLHSDMHVEVIHPVQVHAPSSRQAQVDTNDQSTVIKLKAGDFSVLLGADISTASASAMLARGTDLRATVLKVPHHGSRDGLNETFISAVSPEIAMISVGRGNRFGHPAPETMALLQKHAVKTYRTDVNGSVDIVVTGDGYRMETQR